jgi:hypothetical protein
MESTNSLYCSPGGMRGMGGSSTIDDAGRLGVLWGVPELLRAERRWHVRGPEGRSSCRIDTLIIETFFYLADRGRVPLSCFLIYRVRPLLTLLPNP